MAELVGQYKVRDSRIIVDGNGIEMPLLTFIASLGIRVGDIIRITVTKGEMVGKDTYFIEESIENGR